MPIKFEIEYDQIISIDEIHSIEKPAGVYILMNEDKQPIYIGQSLGLKFRLKDHINGHSNLKKHSEKIRYIALIFEEDGAFRRLIEDLIIYRSKGIFNSTDYFNNRINANENNSSSEWDLFGQCQKIATVSSKRCKNKAHRNGFCYRHGGDGISTKSVINKAVEDYLSGKYNPEID